MTRYFRISLLVVAMAVVVWAGCTDRGTNVPTEPVITQIGSGWFTGHVFENALAFQIKNPTNQLFMDVYIPKVAVDDFDGTPGRPVPAVILLSPANGDAFYYANHGLIEMANQMIADGTIEPMIIVAITNHYNAFGGHFYAGHYMPAGKWDEIFSRGPGQFDDMVDFLVQNFAIVGEDIGDPQISIGGVGQGGYGAFRAMIMNPGLYKAISVTDGPYDFDGADNASGFIDLFDDAMAEQDISGNGSSWTRKLDSASSKPLSRLFMGGALAFSPHDTLFEWFEQGSNYNIIDFRHDSSFFTCIANDTLGNCTTYVETPFAPPPWDSVSVDTIPVHFVIDDNVSFVEHLISAADSDLDFHLPYDSAGNINAPIWNLWVRENLENVLARVGGTPLSGVEVWMGGSPETRFGYHDQSESWKTTLVGAGAIVTDTIYDGFEGNPATHDQYLFSTLRDMLIFHSESFQNAK